MLDSWLLWLESTAFSIWMRESSSLFAFPGILAVHTVGLAFIAGLNAALDLRLLGVATRIPTIAFERFLPAMWMGLWLNVLSGIALLIGYPTKALTNPVFYLKLAFIAAALVILKYVRRRLPIETVPSRELRMLAAASLACWGGAIVAGRLLAYTYTRLTVIDTV
jgi:uncharacterized membrane protein